MPWEPNSFTWVSAGPFSQRFTVSDQQDNQETAHLQQVNRDLTRSLHRCRKLVDDCRAKLAANSNEPFLLLGNDNENDNEEESESDRA